MEYTAKTFTIPTLDGISQKSIDEHLGLYQGYVKNFNAFSALMPEYAKDSEKNALALAEIFRRRSFEFDGMRLHELYFEQFEGGPTPQPTTGPLFEALTKEYQNPEHLIPYMKAIANTRGPGWAMLYWDPIGKSLLAGFVGEQHQGHFATLPIVLALDVWEHAYVLDYGATGKGKYVDSFFKNLNWQVVDNRFAQLQG